jgi:DNA-binding response OmpR family regulator
MTGSGVAAQHGDARGKNVSTILILDDEAAIRARLRLTLAALGHRILEATTADEAFRCFEETDADLDLLITGVNLPGGPSGVRVALELRSLLPSLRVILMLAVPLRCEEDAAEWNELPSDSIITVERAFHPAELLHSVRRSIGVPMVGSGVA